MQRLKHSGWSTAAGATRGLPRAGQKRPSREGSSAVDEALTASVRS